MRTVGGGKTWCWVIAGLLLAQGCSQDASEEEVSKRSAALAVKVGYPFDLESYPKTFNTSAPTDIQFACGTQRCLGVHQASSATGSWAVATRVDAQGNVVDFPRIQLVENSLPLRVFARQDQFLVITQGSTAGGPLSYFLVRGADGAVTPLSPTALPQKGPILGASTGNSWMLVTPEGSGARAQVYDAQLVPRGPGATIAAATMSMMADPIPGPEQYLFGAYGEVVRMDEASGNPIDATPIVVSSLAMPAGMPGVYVDGVYQLAFGSQTILQSRVEAATGKVLNPDDLFNQVMGPTQVANFPARGVGNLDVDLVAGKVVVTQAMVTDRVAAVVVDPKTGLAAGNNGIYAVLQNSIVGDPSQQLHPLNDAVFLVDTDKLLLRGSSAQPLSGGFSSTKLALGVTGIDRFSSRVAASKTGYLVVFARGSAVYQQGSEIVATRVDPKTGAFLDDPPILIGTGEHPSVGSDGENYLVSWLSTADARTHAHYRLVRGDGSMNQGSSAVIFDIVQTFSPSIAFDGVNYGVSWGSRAARIDPTGTFVSPNQPPADSTFYNTGLIPTSGRSSARVAVDTSQPPERRTFLLAGETFVGASDSRDIRIMALRAATGALVGGPIVAEKHRDPFAVSDGTRVLVVSQEEASKSWYGLLVDPVTVAVIPNTRKLMVAEPTPLSPSMTVEALLFDGKSYYLAVRERVAPNSAVTNIHLRRFDANLDRLAEESGSGPIVNGQFVPGFYVDASNLSADQGLFVFQTQDLKRLGSAIKGVFFSADGSTPTTPTSGGAGGTLNTGGSPQVATGGIGNPAQGGRANGGAPNGAAGDAGSASTEGGRASSNGGRDNSSGAAPSSRGGSTSLPGSSGGRASGFGGEEAVEGGAPGAYTGGANGLGGSTSTQSAAGAGAEGTPDAKTSSGCSCRLTADTRAPWPVWALLMPVALLGVRRRNRAS